MATDDYTLQKEVRTQTGLTDESVLADDDLRTLVERAKQEIETELNDDVSDWYSNRDTEAALFWLSCIFAVGEGMGGGDGFSIGELEYRPGDGSTYPMAWDERYYRSLSGIGSGTSRGFGSINIERSDRTYSYE